LTVTLHGQNIFSCVLETNAVNAGNTCSGFEVDDIILYVDL